MASIWDKASKLDQQDESPEGEFGEFDGDSIDISELTDLQLYALRMRIDAKLPPPNMKDLNLATELVRQFQTVQQLQISVMESNEEPAKKATVLNAVNSTLQHLVKMQAEFYTAERLKNIESALIDCIDTLPAEVLKPFFDWYKEQGIERGL